MRIVLPAPASPAPAPVGDPQVDVPARCPSTRPNADFYRVDTALTVPQGRRRHLVTAHLHGMVDRPVDPDLRRPARPCRSSSATSRSPASPTRSAARTSATPAGPASCSRRCSSEPACRPGAEQVLSRSVDGWTCSTPTVGRHRRPRRDARRGHERRAAAARARLPGAHGRARPVRLRLGHQVGHRARAHDLRRDRPTGPARGYAAAGAHQDLVAHRHPEAAGHAAPPARSPSPASRGRRAPASPASRSASTTARGSAPDSPARPASTPGGSGSCPGTRPPAATASSCARPTRPADADRHPPADLPGRRHRTTGGRSSPST